jgi:hypothetical protein
VGGAGEGDAFSLIRPEDLPIKIVYFTHTFIRSSLKKMTFFYGKPLKPKSLLGFAEVFLKKYFDMSCRTHFRWQESIQ